MTYLRGRKQKKKQMNISYLTPEELRAILNEELDKRFGPMPSLEQNSGVKEEYLDTARVCKELNISAKTFYKYRVIDRSIPYIQRGRKIYVKRSDLDAFMEKNRIEAN